MKIINLLEWDAVSETKEDLYLPEEIMRDIVQRLPIRSIIRWKCVSKLWRDLIGGVDFVTSYCPKLVFSCRDTYTVYDSESYVPLFKFRTHSYYVDAPYVATYRIDSVNGLCLMRYGTANTLLVCNPITRQYVELPPQPTHSFIFGFGVSKLSGKYKILYGDKSGSFHICTLGEESWRRISDATLAFPIANYDTAAFLNGNLHWLASDCDGNILICCFDLETELFVALQVR
ncbi:F-box protein DOR-like [Salvia splendens]|uniref:F-box protein DOR-like n=1 Tax=Salvia splendens TaxID=180675 RepID=UPI001C251F72|nr:F-box protein DOR-like [Salvia splendens]